MNEVRAIPLNMMTDSALDEAVNTLLDLERGCNAACKREALRVGRQAIERELALRAAERAVYAHVSVPVKAQLT